MLSRTAKYRRLKQALNVCEEYDDWSNRHHEPDSVKAKSVLIDFFKVYLNMSPDKRFDFGCRGGYYSFYIDMLSLREALEEHNYPRACNELISLCFYEPSLQNRIYVCLKKLYHEYLEE